MYRNFKVLQYCIVAKQKNSSVLLAIQFAIIKVSVDALVTTIEFHSWAITSKPRNIYKVMNKYETKQK